MLDSLTMKDVCAFCRSKFDHLSSVKCPVCDGTIYFAFSPVTPFPVFPDFRSLIKPQPRPIRFYVATKLEHAYRAKALHDLVTRNLGWQITYDWTSHGSVQGQGQARLEQVAAAELNGVRDADVVIVILPGGRGTHAELGAANALGKRVVIYAAEAEMVDPFQPNSQTCAFYWNQNVWHLRANEGGTERLLAMLRIIEQQIRRKEAGEVGRG